jgi:hypothetical protein
MICYNNCYLPEPPRDWSRVQNSCYEMNNKGNILQYKSNGSNLTKSQKYSKIVNKQWINRNTSWASQSTNGYLTNPNINGLKRSGDVINIAIDPITGAILGPTDLPITCKDTVIPKNTYEELPNSVVSSGDQQVILPPIVESTSINDSFPNIVKDSSLNPIVIQDGGTLICTIRENVCNGETNIIGGSQLCYNSSYSDVPGNTELCWKDGTQTWYPRKRYVMSNSLNKWPINAKLSSSIKPSAPIITNISLTGYLVTLNWIYFDTCLPIEKFNIFENNNFIKSVSKDTFTTDISIESCTIYKYYITAVTNGSNISSIPSNEVVVNSPVADGPKNIIVNWSASDYTEEIMDMNIIFDNPEYLGCGEPNYFVVSIFDTESNLITYKNVNYNNSDSLYEINFNNLPFSRYGEVKIYLNSIQNNVNVPGKISSKPYLTTPLPIFINKRLNSSRTSMSFDIISLSKIHIRCIYFYNKNNTIKNKEWDAVDINSPNLTIITTKLQNDEFKISVFMNSELFDLDMFPFESIMFLSNDFGIGFSIF